MEKNLKKVLDTVYLVGNMRQSISSLAEWTKLPPELVKILVKELETMGFIKSEGELNGEQIYRFQPKALRYASRLLLKRGLI